LDVTQNTLLRELFIDENQLTSLDLENPTIHHFYHQLWRQ